MVVSTFPLHATAVIWTDKADYESWETVTIFGSGFNPNTNIDLTITRPDSVIDTGSTISNASGNFVYYYVLNGITGTYAVTATDGVNSANTTFTESKYRLQGYTRLPHAGWTDGILKGWFECEEVPYRLKMIEVDATTYVLSNYHDNELKGIVGIDYCNDFYVGYENGSVAPTAEATFSVSGPFYQKPVKIKEIYYTWNVTYTSEAAGKTYYLYWKAHLASGSSNWPGAKLHAKTDVTGAQDVPIAVPPAVLGEISGYKFNDLDHDGIWDLSEPVLTDGWSISLYMWDETTSQWVFQTSSITDINGYYNFAGLFYGGYKVTEDVKPGWVNTLSPEYPITLNDTYPTSENNNFGNYELVPPVACFTVSNESPNVCETVTFNASCSYDPDGTIVKYEWDWEGNCVYDYDAGNDPIATHHYDTHGTYYPKLRVTDNDGLTNETQTTILVRAHPVARFTWTPEKPQVCETVTFDASASTPDGGVIVSWDWDFGDTTTGTGEIETHHYDTCGDYYVNLTVTDSEAKSDSTTKKIHVSAPPVADFTWTPPDPQECEDVTFDASASDPVCGEIVSYTWDFGDGTPPVIEYDPTITHHYDEWGSYDVTLTIIDNETKSDSIKKTIYVRGYPQADFTWSPLQPEEDQTVTFDASASTPNGGTIASYDWNFGDGHIGTGKIVTHAYTTAGTYTVTLTITDSEGKSDTESKLITVKRPPPPVGGYGALIDKSNLPAPRIDLALVLIATMVATAILISFRRRMKGTWHTWMRKKS